MDKHPLPGKIELFLKDKLTADESLEILLHLENCQECHALLPKKTPEEILEIFLREDVDENEEDEPDEKSLSDEKVVAPRLSLLGRLKNC